MTKILQKNDISFEYEILRHNLNKNFEVSEPLPESIEKQILLEYTCHVDHEGFDLNEIEQEYYKANGISFVHDTTWYKDGDASNGAHAIILPWLVQTNQSSLIIDHSQIVFRYPIIKNAAKQIKQYVTKRPELLRILSTDFKCGLDLCIDYISNDRVYPVVHIEWDYNNTNELIKDSEYVEKCLSEINWEHILPVIMRFNLMSKNSLDAFQQADFRSMLIFGRKSYKLIPTL